MKFEIDTKLDEGDIFFIVNKTDLNGCMVIKEPFHRVVENKVGIVAVEYSKEKGLEIYYQSQNTGWVFLETEIFYTLDEAQTEVDKRNKELGE